MIKYINSNKNVNTYIRSYFNSVRSLVKTNWGKAFILDFECLLSALDKCLNLRTQSRPKEIYKVCCHKKKRLINFFYNLLKTIKLPTKCDWHQLSDDFLPQKNK